MFWVLNVCSSIASSRVNIHKHKREDGARIDVAPPRSFSLRPGQVITGLPHQLLYSFIVVVASGRQLEATRGWARPDAEVRAPSAWGTPVAVAVATSVRRRVPPVVRTPSPSFAFDPAVRLPPSAALNPLPSVVRHWTEYSLSPAVLLRLIIVGCSQRVKCPSSDRPRIPSCRRLVRLPVAGFWNNITVT